MATTAPETTTTLQELAQRHLWLHFSRMGAYGGEAPIPVIMAASGTSAAETAADVGRLDARVNELAKKVPPLLCRLGSTLTQEHGIATVGAMDLLVEVGDPTRFRTEAQFARWCGAAPVAVSSGEGDQAPTHHRLDLAGNRQVNSVLHLMHVTQVRGYPPARDYIDRKRAEHKTKREPAAPTNGILPTS